MSSATVTPSSEATAQPSRPTRSTSTSSGSSSWPSTRKRPPSSSSNSPAASAARTSPSSVAELRPEHRQVRLHAQLGGLDRRRTRPPSRAARRRSRPRAPAAPPAPATTSRRSGWRSFSPDVARACAAELDDARAPRAISSSSAASGSAHARASRRGRSSAGAARHEVQPEVLGQERHHRRDRAQRLHERVPERPERGLVVRPRSAGASGGCTSSRGPRRTPRRRGSRRRSASPRTPRSPRARTACVRATSQRSSGRSTGGPAVEVGERRRRSPRCSRSRRGTRPSSRA